MTERVDEEIPSVGKMTSELNNLKEKQDGTDLIMEAASREISEVETNYLELQKIKKEWEEVDSEIKELEAEVKLLEKKEEQTNSGVNCEGLLGYENESFGEGLSAEYYDNEDFLGVPHKKIDSDVNFIWNNEAPIPKINYENFSIKWKAWLKVPVSGLYKFYTESDDGNQLLLNNQTVIRHFMGSNKLSFFLKISWIN